MIRFQIRIKKLTAQSILNEFIQQQPSESPLAKLLKHHNDYLIRSITNNFY